MTARKTSMDTMASHWAQRFIVALRKAWLGADEGVRREAATYVLACAAPTRAVIYLRHDVESGVVAFGVELLEGDSLADLQVDVVIDPDDARARASLRAPVDAHWRNMMANWFPGRPPDPPLPAAGISGGRWPSIDGC